MAPTRIGDFNKKASDLLTNDYNFDRKFKLMTKSMNGITFTSEGTLAGKKVDAKLTAKLPMIDDVLIEKIQISSLGRFIVEGTLKSVVQRTDVGVKIQEGGGKAPFGEVEVKHTADKFTADAGVSVTEGPIFFGSSSFSPLTNLVLGASFKYQTARDAHIRKDGVESGFADYNVAALYSGKDFQVCFKTKNALKGAGLSVHHEVNKDLSVAASVDLAVKAMRELTLEDMQVGGIYALDSDSKVQAKVNHKALVSANYILNVRPGVKVVASVAIDVADFVGDSHKYGLSLVLG
jgi:voltage-dependent anion channel protein 2